MFCIYSHAARAFVKRLEWTSNGIHVEFTNDEDDAALLESHFTAAHLAACIVRGAAVSHKIGK